MCNLSLEPTVYIPAINQSTMKKILSIAVLLLVVLSASFAQTREERKVSTFTKIAFRVPGKLYLRQGSPQRVELEGDSEFLREVETKVDGNKLTIGKESWMDWNWRDQDKVNVYITVADIEGLSVSGSGDLVGETKLSVNDLDLSVSGSGTLRIEAEAKGDVEADVSGKRVTSLPYKIPPAKAPTPIPSSIKMYRLARPRPLWCSSLRSVAQANSVGEVMPLAMP